MTQEVDTYAWLEEVTGERALDWVRERNQETTGSLGASAAFIKTSEDILAVLDSDAKIPMVSQANGYYYNFWRDSQHKRGLWRRTTPEQYELAEPQWEILLDIDALCEAEDVNWVFHGASLLRPDFSRALIDLSRGGSDADETREFDLVTKTFITPEQGGFYRPESKGAMSWIDLDTVYVFTDFGPDAQGQSTLTPSGYPRVVKRVTRGQSFDEATVVYAGTNQDMYISASHSFMPGFERDFVSRSIAFYDSETYLVGKGDELTKIDVPNSAEVGVSRQWMLVELREDWAVDEQTYPSGALLVIDFENFLAGDRSFTTLFAPSPTTSLAGASWTRDYLVLNILNDVKNELVRLTPPTDQATAPAADGAGTTADSNSGVWHREPLVGLPVMGTTSVGAVDRIDSNDIWVITTDYLTPSTLAIADLASLGAPRVLKTMPTFFDAQGLEIAQHFATSDDGTRVPYFLVHRSDIVLDGTTPTLLYGYGGFEISLTPGYSGGLGTAWLEQGGAYAVANIRGGGEYGPAWHQAALTKNRHKAYEDFSSVAKDLIARGITAPAHLGVQGGSNGGLLTGNMLTQYPDLFGAVVIQVPLLDMKRYSHLLAGASWMAEYGDPDDPQQWEFIRTFSPYHLFDESQEYPPVLFTTSTRDDRVHPAHARKLAAKMIAAGKDVTYYENIEGGHGGAADNKQSAFMSALAYRFLWERLV